MINSEKASIVVEIHPFGQVPSQTLPFDGLRTAPRAQILSRRPLGCCNESDNCVGSLEGQSDA